MATPFVIKLLIRFVIILLSAIINSLALFHLGFQWATKGTKIFTKHQRPNPPATLTDLKWGVHRYVNLKSQGIQLHYVEKGDPTNPLIVCLHGFPECWFSWRHQMLELSSKYWVVAVDLRGYGDSDKPKKGYDNDTLVEDIRQFVLAVAGNKKCILLAHDWGAALAWIVVSKYPELFQSHISLNGPHPVGFMNHMKKSFDQMLKSWYIIFFQMPCIPELLIGLNDFDVFGKMFRGPKNRTDRFPDEVIESYKYTFSKKGALTPPINYYRNIDFAEPLIPKRIKVPTLIIWGTDDTALGKEIAIKSATECDDVRVKFVEGASHWVQQEEPEHVNKLIWEYLGNAK